MADADHVKYETEDFSPRGIRWFTAGLAVLAVMVLVLMAALLWFLSGGRPPGQGVVTPSVPAPNMSPEPDLQVASSQDYLNMRAAEEAQLHSYGWVDRQAGIVRMPIERAIELLTERGLSSRKAEDRGLNTEDRGR